MATPKTGTEGGGADDGRPWLTGVQRRLVTAALVCVSLFVIGALTFGVFLVLRAFVTTFANVLWPLAVAGILALLLRPVALFLQEHLRFSRVGAIAAIYGLILLACAAVIAFVVPVLVEQSLKFAREVPVLLDRAQEGFDNRFPQVMEFLEEKVGAEKLAEYRETLTRYAQESFAHAAPAVGRLGTWLMDVFAWAAAAAIVPVYLFFFLLSDRNPTRDLKEQLSFVRKDIREDIIFLINEFALSMVAFFRGQILIGMIMGVLFAIGFSAVGVNFAIVLGLLLGALNIIPYLGTILGLASVLPIAYFQPEGGIVTAALALLVFGVVQLVESYFLTPRIMGQSTGLHPLVIIIAIFFWGTALGGILGMILAIPLTAFFVVAWRLLRQKYLVRLA